ncbi:two-component system sensor histidine kinase YesM [Acetivibrio thermocellus AD2]|jgi:two-component system sensor histidine kinase YesM|uniref:Signal transduction histidine kinase, LytS n=2 Tax=Acetivibrio thermocellus TaxID=1515 RepID=A3DFT2_ACET2|nr:histidine kinase [Acetivibrio thermocellus]NLG88913.1 sensor histidine kinase [Clostridiaceae bacterium]ABN52811.1 signal transduction histidine kinase, LytS [Acetivibrio thermocellus ATCC 27405]ADU75373.1 signal transduction histidine kinase, LytS [Acetivibrio thermocellus DSM 1313]ALX09367.1 integral membrane sensor signal transduction histidine kinase [Acetivibrio thermocellus AD2]ANV77121.1 integral membrane sensor signal transduction histidine kinase [Acetivibrio thermocellus DSM 2360]
MASNRYRSYVQRTFYRYTFSIILFLCILVILFLIINIKWLTTSKSQRNNAKIAEVLEQEIVSYKEGLKALANDYRIINLCKRQTKEQTANVNRLLYDFSNSQEIRGVFTLVDLQGNLICSNLYKDNRNIFLQSFLYKSLVSKMLSDPQRTFLVPSRLNYSYNQTGDLLIGCTVKDGNEAVGFLFFELLDEEIYETVSRYNVDDVILTDQFNNLIFSIGRQSEDSMGKYPVGSSQFEKNQVDIIELNGKQYLIIKSILNDGTLYLYTLTSISFQQDLFRYAILFVVIMGILILTLLKPLTLLVTDKNLHAIEELRKSILEMGRGNMEYSLRPHVFEEFQELNDTFRQMVLQREELQKRNNELMERKRIMEIRQLEEKINPHFLFNVLETLRYEVMIDPAKASEMIMAFANIMRYNIYYRDTIVPLKTDIEHVKDYLMLQKMRYNRRLTYSIDIPEELMECKVPKLVIQPIVENALKHGMKNVETINVNITASVENENLRLSVEDNGSGIEPEILNELIKDLEREDVYKEHIGMYNSHRVIRLLYGPPYGLKIESTYGKGTVVNIILPINRGDDNE